jgi:hypothetical protein
VVEGAGGGRCLPASILHHPHMHLDQLKAELATILSMEDAAHPEWARIEGRCLELNKRLMAEGRWTCPEVVSHFLDDPDIRRKDRVYEARQRKMIRDWMDT